MKVELQIKAKVLNNENQIEFENKSYSVSELARKILKEKCNWSENARVNGWKYFKINGIILSELREQIEQIEQSDEDK